MQKFLSIFIITFLFSFCSLLQKKKKIQPAAFEYGSISNNYFGSGKTQPFPLTIQRGSNLYSSTTLDGKYLFYTTDKNGNYDIYMRDLSTSVVVPITSHPSAEYKPSVSPDGTKLVFVSEENDSEGDIVLIEIEPEKIISLHLKGKKDFDFEIQNLTNPNFLKSSQRDRFIDTDPCFSPDGKKIIFSSERLSPGKQNLVQYDLQTKKMELLTKEGASSPQYSMDGKSVVFVSFRDSSQGDIYRLLLENQSVERLTSDKFIDLSPSLSPDNKLLYYTSIRKDTNKNGELDLRDNSVIIKKDLVSNKEVLLTSGDTSIFDTKYSTFNGGSILFSESVYNAINVYFIPSFGSIPKQKNIQEQFNFALRLKSNKSKDSFELAIDSISHYFESDPLFPIFDALVLDQRMDMLKEAGKKLELQSLIDQQIKSIGTNHNLYYKKAIVLKWKNKLQNLRYSNDLEKLIAELQDTESKKWIPPILDLIGQEKEERQETEAASSIYKKILSNYKDYYDKDKILRRLGILSFHKNTIQIPNVVFELFQDTNTSLENKREMLEVIEKSITTDRNFQECREHVEKIKASNPQIKDTKQISDLLDYILAKTLNEEKKFNDSNILIDKYSKPIPPEDQLCWSDPNCKLVEVCEDDPTCLKSHILKSKNFEGMGKVNDSFNELKIYLQNYRPELGVEMDKSEMEKTFRYYENKAMDHQNRQNFEAAAFHYFFNTENMYLLKYKNLYVDSLYKDYAVYYQKRMVDSIINFALKQAEDERNNLLRKYNLLGKENLNVIGKASSFFSIFTDNRIAKNLKVLGDVKDIIGDTVLGIPGDKKDAIKLLEQHFNLSRPRARPVLYLASLYGYAYFLINRGVIMDDYYRENESMTETKKERVLEYFKAAEYELKWILYADPNYSDAYQLLGWLYQYIDITKTIKKSDQDKSEGEIYRVAFDKFFPSKNLEENIDLYQQILAFQKDSPNKKVLSDLNLNLANNYLLLNNYPKARDHFEQVEKYAKFINPQIQFENYKQKSLYHYNYARTLLYLNKYEKAIDNLLMSADLYYKNEYYGSKENKKLTGLFKNDQESKFSPAFKLTILHTLIGFSYLEIGKYDDSIYHYKKAIGFNYGKQFIEPMNLYNAMAMAYLKNKNHRLSLHYAQKAKSEYDAKFTGFQFLSKNMSLSNFFWNLALPESFRVIGDSKFPSAFPPEYQYILSLGIEIENYKDLREYGRVDTLYSERQKFLSNKGLTGKSIAKEIYKFDNLNIAYDYYKKEDFKESYKKYSEIYLENNSTDKWKLLRRASFSLFKVAESNSDKKTLSDLNESRSWIQKEKILFFKSCEPPEISEEEKEKIAKECEEKFQNKKTDYDILLGLNYYYTGQIKKKLSHSDSYYYFGLALHYLKNPGNISPDVQFIIGDKFTRIQRLKFLLNEARIYIELQDEENFSKTIEKIKYISKELQVRDIELNANILEISYKVPRAKTKKDFLALKQKILYCLDQLDSNPANLFIINSETIEQLYENLETVFVGLEEWEPITYYRERFQNSILFRNIFSTHFEFENSHLNELYNSAYQSINILLKIHQLKSDGINNRKSISEWNTLEKAEVQKLEKILQNLKKADSKKSVFFDYKSNYTNFQIPENQVLIQFLQHKDFLLAKLYSPNQKPKTIIFKNILKEDFIQNILEQNKDIIYKYDRITFLVDKNFAKINFGNMLLDKTALGSLKKIQYVFKSNHLNTPPRFNLLNINNISITSSNGVIDILENRKEFKSKKEKSKLQIYDTDMLLGEFNETNKENIYGETVPNFVNLKELFQKDHNVAAVVGTKKNYDYESYWILSDILIGSGIDTIGFLHPKENFQGIQQASDLHTKVSIPENKFYGYFHYLNTSINYSIEKFEEKFQKALELERIQSYAEAIDKINEANAFLNAEHKGLRALRAEFVEARLKAKLYKSDNRFYFFDTLLKKYKPNQSFYLIALENVLKYCYTYHSENECENYYQEYYKLLMLKQITTFERRGSYERIRFFRYLSSGKYNRINKEEIKNLAPSIFEDEFLFYYDAVYVFKKYFLLDIADEFSTILSSIAKTPEEQKVASSMQRELQILVHLSGMGPKKEIKGSEDIYSSVLTKDWASFQKFIKNMEVDGRLDVIENFRKRLFLTWQRLETGEDYNPLNIYPEKTSLGESIYSVLEDKDKILTFYILSKSTTEQVLDEVNNLFDILLSEETGINKNLAAYMIINYTEALLGRADYNSAKKYMDLYEKSYQKFINNPSLENRYQFCKYKFALFQKPENWKEIQPTFKNPIQSKYLGYYKKIYESNVENFLQLLTEILTENGKDKFGSSTKRELLDLIFYMQLLSFSRNNSKVYQNLAFFKDRINSINERFYEKSFTLSELTPPKDFVSEILKTIPANQSFICISNFGMNSILVKLESGKFEGKLLKEGEKGKELPIDNRVYRKQIFDYYRDLNDSGNAILQKEALETRFRGLLNLEKGKITYLYLSSSWLKIPLEFKEDDRFYLVQSPEFITKNKPRNIKEYFKKGFGLSNHITKVKDPYKQLINLEKLEFPEKPNSSIVHITGENIEFKDLNQILFEDIPLYKVGERRKREGFWVLHRSSLYETSFFKDDLNHALFLLDSFHQGPGVFSLGPQIGQVSEIYFIKELIKPSEIETNLRDRFVNAHKKLKFQYPSELHWIGYRLYTNCFLTE
jgi:Tol biopolymer transport system component